MVTILRIFRVFVAVIIVWQIIGLVPVLTWLVNPNAVTLGMGGAAVFKIFVAIICAAIYYWLGRVQRRHQNSTHQEMDSLREESERAALHTAALRLCDILRERDIDLGSYQLLAKAAGASLVHKDVFSSWQYVESSQRQINFHNYSELRPWFLTNVVAKLESES